MAAACFAAVSAATAAARAEATGWLQLGGGAMGWKGGEEGELALSPIMTIDLGVGTGPLGPVRLGGLLRVMPVFGEGADVALLARFLTNSFQTDWVGFAFDAGVYQRWWSPESTGFLGQATLGLPLGLQLSALGSYGTGQSYGFGGALGLDLVRLTVNRKHLLDWWPNPQSSDAIGSR